MNETRLVESLGNDPILMKFQINLFLNLWNQILLLSNIKENSDINFKNCLKWQFKIQATVVIAVESSSPSPTF
jgi:hypothetical protein